MRTCGHIPLLAALEVRCCMSPCCVTSITGCAASEQTQGLNRSLRLYPGYLIWGRSLIGLALAAVLYFLRP